MARRTRRQIVLNLDPDDYDLLDAEARRQERDAWGQARYMLTRLLRAGVSVDDAGPPPPAEVVTLDAR